MNKTNVIDYEKLETEIESDLQGEIEALNQLNIEKKEIVKPQKLVESISQIVWEQFIVQIAGNAGKDFIKNNNNLNLSLKKADHYLSQEDFVSGKVQLIILKTMKHIGKDITNGIQIMCKEVIMNN